MFYLHKHQNFTSKERRLIYLQGGPTNAVEITNQIVAVSMLVDMGDEEKAQEDFQKVRANVDSAKESMETPALKEVYDKLTELSKKASEGSLDALRQQVDETRESIVPKVPQQPEQAPPAEEDAANASPDAQKEAAASPDAKAKEEAKKEEEKPEGFVGRANALAEKVGGVMPGTKNWSPEKKRALGYAITIGGTLLVAWLATSASKGKSAGARTGILAGLLVGGACLVGLGMYADKVESAVATARKKVGEGIDKAKKKAGEAWDKVTGWLPWNKDDMDKLAEEFSLTKDEYDKADKIYSRAKDDGLDEAEKNSIRAIFGLAPGENNKDYERFMKHMDEKYEYKEVEGIRYATMAVALRNYEQNTETMLKRVSRYLLEHWGECAVIAMILHKAGITRVMLKGAGLTMRYGRKFAVAAAKFVGKHPLLSIFMIGTPIAALYAVARARKKKGFMPENLPALSLACSKNQDILVGELEGVGAEHIEAIKEHMNTIGNITDDAGEWAASQTSDLVEVLVDKGVEAFGLTEEESAIQNNLAGIDKLEQELQFRLEDDSTGSGEGAPALEAALSAVGVFYNLYRNRGCEELSENDELMQSFEGLKEALGNVDPKIEVTITDGMVSWKSDSLEYDLCVDPSIADKDEFIDKSDDVYLNQGSFTRFLGKGLEEIRKLQQSGLDKVGMLMGSKGLGMIVGNFMYCFEFDKPHQGFLDLDNIKKYYVVPIDIADRVKDLAAGERGAGPKFWGTVSAGAVNSLAFSLNVECLSWIKRVAVGGPKTFNMRSWSGAVSSAKGTLSRIGVRAIPAHGQVSTATAALHGARDVKLAAKMFASGNSLKQRIGRYRMVRELNTVFGSAKIRPELIAYVERGENLAWVADKLKITRAKGAPITKEFLRRAIIEKLNRELLHLRYGQGVDGKLLYGRAKVMMRNFESIPHFAGRMLPRTAAAGRAVLGQAANLARIARLNRLTQLMRLGRIGKVGRVLGPVGAIGLTGGEYVFYYKALKPQLEEMLKNEKDPMKRRQIEREMSSQHIRMGANVVGSVCTLIPFPPVMIGGYAIIATSEAADALRSSIEDSTRYILQDESDLQGYSAGACLNEVGRSKSGKYATVGQAVAANPHLVSFLIPDNNLPILKHLGGMKESFMTANSVARWEAYSAYFAQSAAAQCEPVSPMFLDDKTLEDVEKCESDDKANEMIERRLKTLNEDQVRMYVSAASRYIREKTNKTFDLKDAETMRRAEAYARLYVAEWRREMLDPESAKPFPLADDAKADEMIDKELVERESLVKAELDTLAKASPEEFKVTAVYHMLNSVSHEMALCEKKVISTNYSNVCSWTGWRRWASDEDYRQAARGVFAERVRKVAGKIDAGSWKASSYNQIRGEFLNAFKGKPNDIATEEIYNGRGKKYIEIGKDSYALTVHGVMGAV